MNTKVNGWQLTLAGFLLIDAFLYMGNDVTTNLCMAAITVLSFSVGAYIMRTK